MFLAANLSSATISQPGTLPLVPQIVDAVRVPVIAAGGIADGRGIAAAFALGAAGTQLGTAYLLCPGSSNAAAVSRCPAACACIRNLDDKRVQRTTRAHPG
jgi:nitronate monooxygenase